jgi:hypothetical protein
MTAREYYYRWAGYCSLPCVVAPIVITKLSESYLFSVNLIFNCLALALAVSGIWKGQSLAKICSLFALLIFFISAMTFIGFLADYLR